MFPDKVVHGSPSFTVFAKHYILDVWQGSEYLSNCYYKEYAQKWSCPLKISHLLTNSLKENFFFFAVSIGN